MRAGFKRQPRLSRIIEGALYHSIGYFLSFITRRASLFVISFIALGLVLTGSCILLGSLISVRRLIKILPVGSVRSHWYIMIALIALFIVGYLGYAGIFWQRHSVLIDLVVPLVFFFGACFVLLTTTLSLQTAVDVGRISLLELDAVTDPLTGVFNRRYLDRRLDEEVERARRHNISLAVLMLDIDHFKKVNDQYGHQVGDQVLFTLATKVSGGLRKEDILARFGGEEFVVIAPHTSLLEASQLAERTRQSIESHHFQLSSESGETYSIRVTVSIGVASFEHQVKDKDTLIYAADANLFCAKQGGRNGVIATTPGERELVGLGA